VVDYDPQELVLTVRPGTRLADLEDQLTANRQMLAFEPFDHGPIFGRPVGAATIGGIIAAGVAGSRRVSAGGARDHVLGLRAISGRAETFVAGAKVVKNVTGYDLPKLAANSWGRLFVITELTLKVLPRPETSATIGVRGLTVAAAVRLMALAMGSQGEVAAAAHRPSGAGGGGLSAFRLEGFGPSVDARLHYLELLLEPHGEVQRLDAAEANQYWSDLQTLGSLDRTLPLWRVNLVPSAAPEFLEAVEAAEESFLLDWAGGLIWLVSERDPAKVRSAAAAAGGHAMLVRAPTNMRAATSAFHPQPAGLAALEARVRRAFDPASLFETGRF
jgi:glycolate oxidase FAD binding subunit